MQFVKALLLFTGIHRIEFFGLSELFAVFAVVPDAGCASAAPCSALPFLNVLRDLLQLLLHQTHNMYVVRRAIPFYLTEQIFANTAPRLVGIESDETELGAVGADLSFGYGAFNEVCGCA